MVKAGPPVMGGGGGGKNKCPLCRIEFSQADVVGGAELEKAGGNDAKEEVGAAGLAASASAASSAASTGEEGGKGQMVPPPKVAALLQRCEQGCKERSAFGAIFRHGCVCLSCLFCQW